MPIKYKENWVNDFAPKEINSNIGKVFWFTITLTMIFGLIFTTGLFVIWGHFTKQTIELEKQSEELDQEILCSLQRLELNKTAKQEVHEK